MKKVVHINIAMYSKQLTQNQYLYCKWGTKYELFTWRVQKCTDVHRNAYRM